MIAIILILIVIQVAFNLVSIARKHYTDKEAQLGTFFSASLSHREALHLLIETYGVGMRSTLLTSGVLTTAALLSIEPNLIADDPHNIHDVAELMINKYSHDNTIGEAYDDFIAEAFSTEIHDNSFEG